MFEYDFLDLQIVCQNEMQNILWDDLKSCTEKSKLSVLKTQTVLSLLLFEKKIVTEF